MREQISKECQLWRKKTDTTAPSHCFTSAAQNLSNGNSRIQANILDWITPYNRIKLLNKVLIEYIVEATHVKR